MLSFKLSNMRNQEERYICFINAVLQFMYAIPVIRKFFINRTYQQSTARNYRICSEITRIFRMAGSQSFTSAAALRHEVGSLYGNDFVKNGHQQGADDFLKALIKAIEKEIGCEDTDIGNSVNHNSICVIRNIEGKEAYEKKLSQSEDGACQICGYRMRKTEEYFRIFHLLKKNFAIDSLQILISSDSNLSLALSSL